MSLTPEQAQAAFAEGSVAVVAGAGTGKTHMLSTRYLHHLSQGRSPLEIVAVTFTERAADELKARVRRAAQGAAIGPDALAELEAAQIGTLHALAARICRDHPDAAGVPPDFGMLDDLERTVWLGEQFAAALGSLPPGTLGALSYSRLEAALAQLLEEPSLASAAFAHGPETWPELIARERAGAKARLTEHPEWRAAMRTLLTHVGAPEDPIERARQGALRGLEALEREANAEAMTYFAAINRRGGSVKRWPQGGLSEVQAALKVVQELSKAAHKDGRIALELGEADDRLAALLPALKGAFEAVQTHIAAAKCRERVLDFADLDHTPPTTTPELMLGRGLGVALRLGDDEGSAAEPALYTILKGRARAREREEAKRVLYVALTRARDRVLLTATQPKGGGLELLSPGLAALGLSCDEILHDPVSLYPDLPAPAPPTPPSTDAALWSRAPAALGRYARYVDPKGAVTDAAPTADTRSNAWDEVLMLVGEMDEGWLPHLRALRDAGVSAPHPDTVFRELTAGGTVTPYPSVCSWGDGKGALALVDAATPPRTFDQRLLRLDPVEQIQDTVERVRAALEG